MKKLILTIALALSANALYSAQPKAKAASEPSLKIVTGFEQSGLPESVNALYKIYCGMSNMSKTIIKEILNSFYFRNIIVLNSIKNEGHVTEDTLKKLETIQIEVTNKTGFYVSTDGTNFFGILGKNWSNRQRIKSELNIFFKEIAQCLKSAIESQKDRFVTMQDSKYLFGLLTWGQTEILNVSYDYGINIVALTNEILLHLLKQINGCASKL